MPEYERRPAVGVLKENMGALLANGAKAYFLQYSNQIIRLEDWQALAHTSTVSMPRNTGS